MPPTDELLRAIVDLEISDEAWRRALAQKLRPWFPSELGVVVAELTLHAGGARIERVASADTGVAGIFSSALGSLSAPAAHAVVTRGSRIGTYTEWSEGTGAEALWHEFSGDAGFEDWVGFCALDGGERVLLICAPGAESLSDAFRRQLQPLVSHVATMFRLRRSLGGAALEASLADAVLDPRGKLLHAEEPAKARTLREKLREAVRRRAGDPSGVLWDRLVAGRWSLVDRFDFDGKRHFLAIRNDPHFRPRHALTERERQVARMAAQGLMNKEIAFALGIAESTVATHLRRALGKIGVTRRSELPLLYEESARPLAGVRHAAVITPGEVSAPELTPSELEVVLLAADGRSNQQIADVRGSAVRTVANLLRRAFQKLGVSSRTEAAAALRQARKEAREQFRTPR